MHAKRNLPRDERQERQEAGVLDGEWEFALMGGANARAPATANSRMGIQKTLERFHIFIVNMSDIVIAKVTVFHSLEIRS